MGGGGLGVGVGLRMGLGLGLGMGLPPPPPLSGLHAPCCTVTFLLLHKLEPDDFERRSTEAQAKELEKRPWLLSKITSLTHDPAALGAFLQRRLLWDWAVDDQKVQWFEELLRRSAVQVPVLTGSEAQFERQWLNILWGVPPDVGPPGALAGHRTHDAGPRGTVTGPGGCDAADAAPQCNAGEADRTGARQPHPDGSLAQVPQASSTLTHKSATTDLIPNAGSPTLSDAGPAAPALCPAPDPSLVRDSVAALAAEEVQVTRDFITAEEERQLLWEWDPLLQLVPYDCNSAHVETKALFALAVGDVFPQTRALLERLQSCGWLPDPSLVVSVVEYGPASGILPHVDDLLRKGDAIVGVSLCSDCVMVLSPGDAEPQPMDRRDLRAPDETAWDGQGGGTAGRPSAWAGSTTFPDPTIPGAGPNFVQTAAPNVCPHSDIASEPYRNTAHAHASPDKCTFNPLTGPNTNTDTNTNTAADTDTSTGTGTGTGMTPTTDTNTNTNSNIHLNHSTTPTHKPTANPNARPIPDGNHAPNQCTAHIAAVTSTSSHTPPTDARHHLPARYPVSTSAPSAPSWSASPHTQTLEPVSVDLHLPRRSLYRLSGRARYEWEHSIPPGPHRWGPEPLPRGRRVSLTFTSINRTHFQPRPGLEPREYVRTVLRHMAARSHCSESLGPLTSYFSSHEMVYKQLPAPPHS